MSSLPVADRLARRLACHQALQRLQTDYLDLYQVHWPERAVSGFGANTTIRTDPPRLSEETPIEESLAALADHVKAGRIRAIGLSNESAWGTMRWFAAADALGVARPVTIQNAYNLINRSYEVSLAEVSDREGIGLLAYSPLGQGYLTGKYRGGARPAGVTDL